MSHRFLCTATFALVALVSPAHAQTPPYEKVLSAVTLDFTSNGRQDRAVLVENDDTMADLYLYLLKDDQKGRGSLALAETKKSFVSSGGWGQLPSLEATGRGSLLVKSGNEAIGRDRWSQTLTIVYRNKEFLIGGVSHTSRDTLDLNAGGSCDLNLLTGKGSRNGKPVTTKSAPIRLADWSDEKLPKECQF